MNFVDMETFESALLQGTKKSFTVNMNETPCKV